MNLSNNWTKEAEDLYNLLCLDEETMTEEQKNIRNNFYNDATLRVLKTFELETVPNKK